MPAAGTHYHFAQLVLHQCPPPIAQVILAEKDMFDLGAQGPDLLFFYRPYRKTPISQLGHSIHSRSGDYLLLPILSQRTSWSPALTAYLLGLCCHYGLDRTCHPLIIALAPSNVEHQRIESALDRLVFDHYAITIPRYKMLPRGGDISALQAVYSQLTPAQLRECVRSTHGYNHLLEHPRLVTALEGLLGKRGKFSEMCLPATVAEDAPAHQILPLFHRAIPSTLKLLELLMDPEMSDETLLAEMNLNYEGVPQ